MNKSTIKKSGISKLAILLTSLDQNNASKLLKRLDLDDMEKVSMEICKTKSIPYSDKKSVMNDFYDQYKKEKLNAEGGFEVAKNLITRSLPQNKSMSLIKNIDSKLKNVRFKITSKAKSENILAFIKEEHPQTISIVLAYLSPNKSSEILEKLPPKTQIEVTKRLCSIEHISSQAIDQIEDWLESKLQAFTSNESEAKGGVQFVANVMNSSSRYIQKAILENLEEDNPELYQGIKKCMFTFGDIMYMPDVSMRRIINEVDNNDLALALKGSEEEVLDKIFSNMSERSSQYLQDEMDYLPPVRVKDVEEAQQRVIDIIRRLEESEDLVINVNNNEMI
jgi:flagellar motor switch protein FliG